jgi:hypothetical protein
MKTIGFFGDSFCAERRNAHSLLYRYDSYMIKLEEYYNLKTVNVGHGGSSVWDLILNQYKPLEHNLPDVCVFVWTKPGRLYHKTERSLSIGHVMKPKIYSYNIFRKGVWDAAKAYYTHLYDHDKETLEYRAILKYFDEEVLSKISSKIVHLWSTGNPIEWTEDGFKEENVTYDYEFKNGIEVRPCLTNISLQQGRTLSMFDNDMRCNHLEGDDKNQQVFEMIKSAIDQQ